MSEIARMSSSLRTSFGGLMNSASPRQASSTARAICTYFSSQFVSLQSSIFYFTRGRSVSRSSQTTGYMIATLLVFLQLKYLTNDNKTPFRTHPHTMGAAIFSTFMYYLACSVHLQHSFRQFSVLSHYCMVWFGDIAVASLMSMFMPDWARPLLYLVCGLISAREFLQKLFVEETGGPFRFWNDLGRLCSLERAHILPR